MRRTYGQKFIDALYEWFVQEKKTLSYGNSGVFLLLSYEEKKAVEVMSDIEKGIWKDFPDCR